MNTTVEVSFHILSDGQTKVMWNSKEEKILRSIEVPTESSKVLHDMVHSHGVEVLKQVLDIYASVNQQNKQS